jgi:hypothetical protein
MGELMRRFVGRLDAQAVKGRLVKALGAPATKVEG